MKEKLRVIEDRLRIYNIHKQKFKSGAQGIMKRTGLTQRDNSQKLFQMEEGISHSGTNKIWRRKLLMNF